MNSKSIKNVKKNIKDTPKKSNRDRFISDDDDFVIVKQPPKKKK